MLSVVGCCGWGFTNVLVCFGAGQGGAVGGGSYQEENSDCKRQADSALQPQRGTLLYAARSAGFSELPDVLYLNQCGFFRRSLRETPWPSRCTAPCSTGSSCGSIMRCLIRKTWRSPFQWEITIFRKLSIMFKVLFSSCFCIISVFVYWCPWHLRLRRLWDQQLWTILHQLRQRAASVLLQPAHF